jgi:hypothetical protein
MPDREIRGKGSVGPNGTASLTLDRTRAALRNEVAGWRKDTTPEWLDPDFRRFSIYI